jgi:SAM-dependent methyltransferase
LDTLGLLDIARETYGWLDGARWLKSNWPIWRQGAADGLPLPPMRLIRSSTGTPSLAWYLEGGARAARAITEVVERNHIRLQDRRAILDFGCGCGRVIRHWKSLSGRIHGSDYNAAVVAWCRRNLAFAHFTQNSLAPPLRYPDEQFDLVYALSVFTHLPEPLLHPWVKELSRVLVPGGHLIVTTHGRAYLASLNVAEQQRFESGQVVVKDPQSAGTNRCGVYMSAECVRALFAPSFELLDAEPEGAAGNPRQDLYLLAKR